MAAGSLTNDAHDKKNISEHTKEVRVASHAQKICKIIWKGARDFLESLGMQAANTRIL